MEDAGGLTKRRVRPKYGSFGLGELTSGSRLLEPRFKRTDKNPASQALNPAPVFNHRGVVEGIMRRTTVAQKKYWARFVDHGDQ